MYAVFLCSDLTSFHKVSEYSLLEFNGISNHSLSLNFMKPAYLHVVYEMIFVFLAESMPNLCQGMHVTLNLLFTSPST